MTETRIILIWALERRRDREAAAQQGPLIDKREELTELVMVNAATTTQRQLYAGQD